MSHLKKSWDFCNAFFYHMEIGMPKQLKQASFVLVLYRIRWRLKPSSFVIIQLYCFDYYYSFASGLQMHAQPSLGVQNILRFWVLEIFHLQLKTRQLSLGCLFRSFKSIFLRGDQTLESYINRFYKQYLQTRSTTSSIIKSKS